MSMNALDRITAALPRHVLILLVVSTALATLGITAMDLFATVCYSPRPPSSLPSYQFLTFI